MEEGWGDCLLLLSDNMGQAVCWYIQQKIAYTSFVLQVKKIFYFVHYETQLIG
jgi:hypothetical protein